MTPAKHPQMEQATSTAAVVSSTDAALMGSGRLGSTLLNRSLDDIIKDNRQAVRKNKGPNKNKNKKDAAKPQGGVNKNRSLGKPKAPASSKIAAAVNRSSVGKVVKRVNSGRPASVASKSSAPRLRQPWEKPVSLPSAPLPSEPLKISIRNELAERDHAGSSSFNRHRSHQPHRASSNRSMSDINAAGDSYNSRDDVGSRKEYRLGNRFSTQSMNIEYHLDTRRN